MTIFSLVSILSNNVVDPNNIRGKSLLTTPQAVAGLIDCLAWLANAAFVTALIVNHNLLNLPSSTTSNIVANAAAGALGGGMLDLMVLSACCFLRANKLSQAEEKKVIADDEEQGKLDKLEEENKKLTEKLREMEDEKERLKQELTQKNKLLEEKEKQFEEDKKRLAEQPKLQEDYKEKYKTLEADFQRLNEKISQDIAFLQIAREEEEKKAIKLTEEKVNLVSENKKLTEENKKLADKKETLNSLWKELNKEFNDCVDKRDSLKRELELILTTTSKEIFKEKQSKDKISEEKALLEKQVKELKDNVDTCLKQAKERWSSEINLEDLKKQEKELAKKVQDFKDSMECYNSLLQNLNSARDQKLLETKKLKEEIEELKEEKRKLAASNESTNH